MAPIQAEIEESGGGETARADLPALGLLALVFPPESETLTPFPRFPKSTSITFVVLTRNTVHKLPLNLTYQLLTHLSF